MHTIIHNCEQTVQQIISLSLRFPISHWLIAFGIAFLYSACPMQWCDKIDLDRWTSAGRVLKHCERVRALRNLTAHTMRQSVTLLCMLSSQRSNIIIAAIVVTKLAIMHLWIRCIFFYFLRNVDGFWVYPTVGLQKIVINWVR